MLKKLRILLLALLTALCCTVTAWADYDYIDRYDVTAAPNVDDGSLTITVDLTWTALEELSMELDFTSPGWLPEETLRALGLHLIPSCGACLSNMAIAPDGSIIPCQSWLSTAPLGNMLTDDWSAVWNSDRCAAIRAESARMDHICQLYTGNREEAVTC